MPSMEEAGQIFDATARHSYVFDNGLSSIDFFDVEKRVLSEEFELIRKNCGDHDFILEAGCFTGLNLLGLGELGYQFLWGIDFVEGAIGWLKNEAKARNLTSVSAIHGSFPQDGPHGSHWDRIVCFDVLEHQLDVGKFLSGVQSLLSENGKALFLVPKGREYYDCGHVAFFPDEVCFRNVLEYYFDVEEVFELKSCQKLFACCKRKS